MTQFLILLNSKKPWGEHARKGIELQANVFASNLLVPREQLIVLAEKIFPEIYKLAKEEGIDSFSGLNAMLADDMAVNFGVSFEMVQNRLYIEKVVDHLMPKGY
ncbi:MAG: ImmA/IrrE family metallo-endopeptidase [Bacteroidia bacterium]|nr:ImmA/IrrE family metallo-endopeptidase [Bacteroidia bacterium]